MEKSLPKPISRYDSIAKKFSNSTLSRSNPPSDKNIKEDYYIFGYGSLIWKCNFEYKHKEWSYIKGYTRSFLQRSADHRGTLWNPGRVCTLKPNSNPETVCWGVVYRICGNVYHKILQDLDVREKGGYIKKFVPIYNEQGNLITDSGLVYYGNGFETIGDEPMDKTASIIANAVGPTGPNTEYLYSLTNILRERGLLHESGPDSYLYHLEILTREYENKQLCYISPELKENEEMQMMMQVVMNKMKISTAERKLGIRVIYISKSRVKYRLTVTRDHAQPMDILHGGISVLLGEGACSLGALVNCPKGAVCVGQEINCNHLRPVPATNNISVTCIAMPIRVGQRSQVWEFKIVQDGTDDLVATGRMTASVISQSRL